LSLLKNHSFHPFRASFFGPFWICETGACQQVAQIYDGDDDDDDSSIATVM